MAAKKKNKSKKIHVGEQNKTQAQDESNTDNSQKSNDTVLSMEFIKDIGGEKVDLQLLEDVDLEEDEVVEVKEDLDADPVSRDEVRELVTKLGLDLYRPDRKEKEAKPKKIKLASMPEDAGNDAKPGSSGGVEQQGLPQPVEVHSSASSTTSTKKNRNKYKVQHEEISSTTAESESHSKKFDFTPSESSSRKYLLIKPGSRWHEHEFTQDPTVWTPISKEQLKKLQDFANTLFDADVALYKKQQDKKKSSDAAWMRTVLTSGTSQDKVAALTVLVHESPLHCLGNMDTLINMVKKKGRREVNMALDTLRELFLGDLLPDQRKLRSFDSHPFSQLATLSSGNKDSRDKRLLYWIFEHKLKDRYQSFVEALQNLSHDTVAATKKKAVDTVFAMLCGKPEQEKVLLNMLVNKLGDPDHKIAAHTAHLLTRLVEAHPNMKKVIIMEVERLLYRPNITAKAQYYAVCFLNQLVLSPKEKQIASRLISIYFSFFKAFVKRKELDSKMLSGLLAGVNRAYPYAKVEQELMETQMGTLYKLIPTINFNTSIQALLLLYQVIDTNDSMCDRYYMSLYRKMLDPELQVSSKQALFLNLLFKSMKKDNSAKRIQAFVKRLLQVCCQQNPTFTCGALVLLSELLKVRREILRISKASEGSDDEEEHFSDHDDDDEEEHFVDKDDGEPAKEDAGQSEHHGAAASIATTASPATSAATSWIHRRNTGDKRDVAWYDPYHRNPLYSKAETDCLWELERLAGHYHPSVSLFAQTILKGEKISYPGNPLQDFTLIRFLDRFVYRNPKKKDQLPPTSQSVIKARQQGYAPQGARAIAVNTPEYLATAEQDIPVDERFFYQFFQQKAAKSKQVEDEDSDAGSISDSEFDDYLGTFEKGLLGEARDEMTGFDFASELRKQKGKKKDDGEDDGDDDLDLSDEEVDFDDEDFGDAFEGDVDDLGGMGSDQEEENVDDEDGDDADDFGDLDFASSGKKRKKKGGEDDLMAFAPAAKKGRRGKGDDLSSMFAAAEDFAHLIDDTAGDQVDTTGTEAMANKEKASVKQLKWESNRDKWLHDQDWKSRKRGQPHKGKKFPAKKGGGSKGGANKRTGGGGKGGANKRTGGGGKGGANKITGGGGKGKRR